MQKYRNDHTPKDKPPTQKPPKENPVILPTRPVYTIETIDQAFFYYQGGYYFFVSASQIILKEYIRTMSTTLCEEDMFLLEEDYHLDHLDIWYLANTITS